MAVDLATAKAQLNLTTSDDDALVTRLLSVAQNWLEAQIGYQIAAQYPNGSPAALDHAIYLMVGHYYANREASWIGGEGMELPLGVADIIQSYRTWSWGDDGDQ